MRLLQIRQIIYSLGFERDRTGLSGPQMNVIAVQAAAQVTGIEAANPSYHREHVEYL